MRGSRVALLDGRSDASLGRRMAGLKTPLFPLVEACVVSPEILCHRVVFGVLLVGCAAPKGASSFVVGSPNWYTFLTFGHAVTSMVGR